jgi:adenine phosphoribosyltransferase
VGQDRERELMNKLKAKIRHVPDFPKPGILFYDITTLLNDAEGFRETVAALAAPYRETRVDQVVGIESRGFILGAAVANALGAGFVPIRKPGKLPSRCFREDYALEYGTDGLEIHEDAVQRGHRVLLVDDVLATGGTARAASGLVRRTGAELVGLSFLIELNFLKGREKLAGEDVFSVLQY